MAGRRAWCVEGCASNVLVTRHREDARWREPTSCSRGLIMPRWTSSPSSILYQLVFGNFAGKVNLPGLALAYINFCADIRF
jgi:hypothetical protein